MSTFDLDRSNISDSDLIEHVRAGDTAAFAVLHDRHAGSARALARRMSRSTADADDLVNEGFARVLRALQNGKGPDIAFRPYLLSTIRRLAYDRTTREQRESPSATDEAPEPAAQTSDPVLDGFERETAAAAFASLPERWRMVLWHTEVEGQSPAEVAELLGMKANAVAALAYRAREGLRQAYLTEHTPKAGSTKECELTAGRLGSYVRGGLTPAREARVRRHLEECDDCQAAYLELASVNTSMPAIVAFAVLGPFGFGYLAKASGTAGAAFQRAISPLIQVDASAAGAGGVLAGAGAVGAGAARRVRHLAAVAAATVVVGAVAVIAAVHGGGGPNVQRTATGPTNSGPVVDTVSTPARPRSAAPSPDTAATSTSTMPSTIPPQPTTNHPAAPTTTEDGPGGSTGIAPPKRPPESSRMTVTVDSAGHLVRNRPGVLVADVSNAGAGTGRNARLTLDLRGATLRGLPEAPILDRSDAWDCDLVSPTSLACERNSVAADDTTSVYVPVSVSAGTAPVEVRAKVTAAHDETDGSSSPATTLPVSGTGMAARFATVDRGDLTTIGNTLLTCDPSDPRCPIALAGGPGALDNGSFPMRQVDVDDDPTTANSSSATLSVPAGSQIASATLYWSAGLGAGNGGLPAPAPDDRGRAKLRPPSGPAFVVEAERVDEIPDDSRYQAVADVTAEVRRAGAGRWTFGGVQTGTGENAYAGWSLVVVYRSAGLPVRSLVVLDGFAAVNDSATVSFKVGGFTVPATGPRRAVLDVVTYEGDTTLLGDQLRVNGAALTDGSNPAGNTFNSTATAVGGRNPAWSNLLGIDIDRFDVSDVLTPGSTSTTIEFSTGADRYLTGAVAFAIDQ